MHKLLGMIAAAVAMSILACGSDSAQQPLISFSVEVLEADAPVTVGGSPATWEDGETLGYKHGVLVTWRDTEPAVLDDARFVPDVDRAIAGDVPITVGRGCSVAWDDELEIPLWGCNDDLQLVELELGETHEYPVTLLITADSYHLATGTHVVEEPIRWWSGTLDDWLEAGSTGPAPPPDGEFTIRLTYTVE